MTGRPILVMGTTAYAEVFMDMFEAVPGIVFAGCVENLDRARCADKVLGRPVHWFEDIGPMAATHDLICVLATTHRADWIEIMAGRGHAFATLVHPSSVVSGRSTLAPGCSVDAGGVIAGFTEIAPHVRIGRRVSIGHHSRIGAFSTIHPAAAISGNCSISARVMIGTGAVILDGMTIGDGAVVAAGAVVTRNLAPGALVAGNPAMLKRPDYGPR